MIHAINKGKTSIELKEDTRTSMILGSLLHLPTTVFWQILRRACKDEQILPRICRKIDSIEFWPEWSTRGEYNNMITDFQLRDFSNLFYEKSKVQLFQNNDNAKE